MRNNEVIAKPPVPEEAFDRYPGKWIALRSGEVVIDAESQEQLRDDPHVHSEDILFHVPESATYFYNSSGPHTLLR